MDKRRKIAKYLYKAKEKRTGKEVVGTLFEEYINTYPTGKIKMIVDGKINYDELDYYGPDFIAAEIDESTIEPYICKENKS